MTILENPDPVFEAFNDFAHEFEKLIEEMRSDPSEASAIASEISDHMITVATTVKNAEFLIFKARNFPLWTRITTTRIFHFFFLPFFSVLEW